MTDARDPADFAEVGRKLFAGEASFIWAASAVENLPPISVPEIAFAGRSNVGKSSLVNALTGRKVLARTSHTPGRTQELNFFDLGGRLRIVDMPGYGYAAAGKEKVASWTRLVRSYLRGRQSLARVYLLVDSRHGAKESDLEVMGLLDISAVSYQVVLTKADEPKAAELDRQLETMKAVLLRRPAAFPEIRLTSSREGTGMPELRGDIARLLAEREGHA